LPTDLLVESTNTDFPQTGFKVSSILKLDKVATVEASIILGELGELSAALLTTLNDKLRYAFEL